MRGYVRTDTILDKILANTAQELLARKAEYPLVQVRSSAETSPHPRDFIAALHKDTVALIAEVKHASPSRGVLVEHFDPVHLARLYTANGAAAISVLTDQAFFKGHLNYLTQVREALNVPLLRKDFIIDPYQVYEARAAGADAVLLIVAALEDRQLEDLYALTQSLSMAALVETHNAEEMERAIKIGASLVGINNRNLKTFDVDLGTTASLASMVPDTATLVAESGIHQPEDVHRMGHLGAHAVLVGEALVTAADTSAKVKALSGVLRKDSHDHR